MMIMMIRKRVFAHPHNSRVTSHVRETLFSTIKAWEAQLILSAAKFHQKWDA